MNQLQWPIMTVGFALALSGLSINCGDDAKSSADEAVEPCVALCTDAGFSSGDKTDFGGGLIECICSGSGDGISQRSCSDYCADFDVSADDSLLSSKNTADDKCVCDGT